MPTEYHHGVRVIEVNDGIRPIRTIATAIVGFVATSSDADDTVFPVGRLALITNPQAAIAKAGTTGTLKRVLECITAQSNPVCIVARVSPDEEATQGEIDSLVNTAVLSLASSKSLFGITPRIIGMPGLENAATVGAAGYLDGLRMFYYGYAYGCAAKEDAAVLRNSLSARNLMLIWPDFKRSTAGDDAGLVAVATALGLRAKIDEEVGWHKTISNVAVNGVTGLTELLFVDLQSTASDNDYLNGNDVTTMVNHKGFRFWGSRTCSDDPLFAFENYTRTAHVLADTISEAMLWAVDKPMHPSLVKDILDSINAKFRQLKALGYIIDANAWYDETVNSPTTLKDGQLYIDYDYTPVPPLENLMLRQRITDRYLADFAQRINAA